VGYKVLHPALQAHNDRTLAYFCANKLRLLIPVVICRCSESSPGGKYRLDRAQKGRGV